MAPAFQDLPVELLDHVLHYLSLADLLSFARTSKLNYNLSVQVLTSLDLAIFPRRIHSLLAFFDASEDTEEEEEEEEEEDDDIDSGACWNDLEPTQYGMRQCRVRRRLHQVGLTTPSNGRLKLSRVHHHHDSRPSNQGHKSDQPPTPSALRTAEITCQNNHATSVLSTPSLANLHSLTLRLYDLTCPDLALTIATSFPHLRALSLEFSHPYIHDTTLPARFWRDTAAAGSPIWNILAGAGQSHEAVLRLRNLQSLRLSRCGITSFQLRHWVQANPELRELRLSLCRGVDVEFVTWLGKYMSSGQSKLEVIRLTQCGLLELRKESDFAWITAAAKSNSLKELSLLNSRHVNEDVFLQCAAASDNQDCRKDGHHLNQAKTFWLNDGNNEDDTSNGGSRWSRISKLVSPKGVVIRRQQNQHQLSSEHKHIGKMRLGNVSPALTVSDDMLDGSGGSSSKECGSSDSAGHHFGHIEADATWTL